MTIHQAKEMLRKAGYHVDSMWHIDDVMANYECDSQTAIKIIEQANEYHISDFFDTTQLGVRSSEHYRNGGCGWTK